MAVDHDRAEAAVRELLLAIGEDPEREGLRDTPARVARAYAEMFAGLEADAGEMLSTQFDIDHQEMVLVRDIGVEHLRTCSPSTGWRMSPTSLGRRQGHGPVQVGAAGGVYAKRPQVQERLTSQVADAWSDTSSRLGRWWSLSASTSV